MVWVVLASEAGVLDLAPGRIEKKGRLQPGRMLLIDTAAGRIISDRELKNRIAADRPYRSWLDQHLVDLDKLPKSPDTISQSLSPSKASLDLVQRQQAFGYTFEDLRLIIGSHVTKWDRTIGLHG